MPAAQPPTEADRRTAPTRGRGIVVAIALLAAFTVAVYLGWSTVRSNNDAPAPSVEDYGSYAPPPASVDDFADRMTAVVTGAYVEIVDVTHAPVPAFAADRGQQQGTPITLMRFVVSEYLVGDGPTELLVGQYGDLPQGVVLDVPAPAFNEQITLITAPWTLDSSIHVALYGAYGRLVEQDGRLQYAFIDDDALTRNPQLASIPFARGLSIDGLHLALQEAARARGLPVPSAPDP
jgi:hypothetical protein